MNPKNSYDENNEPVASEVPQRQTAPELSEQLASDPVPEQGEDKSNLDIDDSEAPETLELPETSAIVVGPKKNIFKRLLHWPRSHKKISIPLGLLIVIATLLVVPITRYALAGYVLKNDFKVTVFDETTKKPVTNATVTLNGLKVKTDNKGQAALRVKVGNATLNVEKKYYRTINGEVLVPITSMKSNWMVFLQATGRQVPVEVTDKISGQPIENALIRAEGSEVRTNTKGEAILVLPAEKATVDTLISATNYNGQKATVTVTDQIDAKNKFKLTPTGKLYFLSKLSGKIDVVKTNLDGTERQTVLAGTGNESDTETVLLASRDWKYLAFKAKRDNGIAKVYLINTATDNLTTIDESNANFSPVGWYGGRFVYVTYNNSVQNWQPYGQTLKSFDVTTGKLNVIDQTSAEGASQADYAYTSFSNVYITENELVYAKNWLTSNSLPNRLDGKSTSLISIKPDGSSKKTIKDFAIPIGTLYSYAVELSLYAPQGIYVRAPAATGGSYYSYENGKFAAKTDLNDQQFYGTSYATYLVSPSGSKTFWSEARDGKNTLFVGDNNGKNGKQIATLSSYAAYGWYSDDYLLVSKNSSELFVMPVAGGEVTKVTDYHKQAYDFRGYGYGYGGL